MVVGQWQIRCGVYRYSSVYARFFLILPQILQNFCIICENIVWLREEE